MQHLESGGDFSEIGGDTDTPAQINNAERLTG
jgi:hypothetical protein